MPAPRILAFAGSTREKSFNKMLIRIAAASAQAAGGDVTLVDLRDYPMPLYDGDLEAREGIPEHARRFKELMLANDGLLISAPEYNGSITGVLKNTIDWASRSAPDEAPLAPYVGKVAALLAASPGALGGLRGLVHVRAILGNLKVLVLPEQVAVMRAGDVFAPDGTLKDPKTLASVTRVAESLVTTISKLRA
jgi:NAD(P)H-dependent FMN reductase